MRRPRRTPERKADAARLRGRALVRLAQTRADRDTRLEIGEGLLLADSAVRMAVKNHVLVEALGPGSVWDPDRHRSFAAETLRRIADQQDAAATRMAGAREDAIDSASGPDHEHDYGELDVRLLDKRRTVYRSVAAELRRRSGNEEELRAVVEEGRADAWFELGAAIEQRLVREVCGGVLEDRSTEDAAHRAQAYEAVKQSLAADLAAPASATLEPRTTRRDQNPAGDRSV